MNTLKPFKRFCITLGEIPSSYLESMSYYETLVWLCNYLKKTIEPSLKETQEAVTELQEFVSHYFDNLDVQEEINNKLDEMAESGELTDIIAQYLDLAGILAYNTTSDMVEATNLTNGSTCYTLGQSTYNDGKGAFYKIRTITSSDVVDGVNIIALNVSDTLIAEKISNFYINQINSNINNINSELSILKNRKYIFIGDSYGTGQNELQEQTIPWTTLVPQYLGLTENDYYKTSINGSGFVNGYGFKNQLIDLDSTITNKNEITDIVVIGGYNDLNSNVNAILSAIEEFCTYAKTNYINANISIGCVGWTKYYDNRQNIACNVIPAYTKCGKFGANYLKNVEYILHDYSLFSGDNYHPSQDGQNELSIYLTEAIKYGSCNVIRSFIVPTTEVYDNTNTLAPSYILENQVNDKIELLVSGAFFTIGTAITLNRDSVLPLLKLKTGLIMGSGIPVYKQYQNLFCANGDGSSQYDIPIDFSVIYDSTNTCGNLQMYVSKTKDSINNIKAFLFGEITLTMNALFC